MTHFLEIEQQASQLALPPPGQQLSLPSTTHPALIQTPTTTTHNLMSALALGASGQNSRDLSNNNSHNQGRVSRTVHADGDVLRGFYEWF